MNDREKAEIITIGIDVGTTYCRTAFLQNSTIKFIKNECGNITWPTTVTITNSSNAFGDLADPEAQISTTETIFGLKGLLGVTYNETSLLSNEYRSYELINDKGLIKIEVNMNGQIYTCSPEELFVCIVQNMKYHIDKYFGQSAPYAVVTVPTMFSQSRQQALSECCRKAGMHVLSVLCDPIAAAIACGLDHTIVEQEGDHLAVVFCMGGGCLDVAVLFAGGGFFEVKSTSGDTHLGGEDFDTRLVKHFVEEFKRKFRMDPSGNKRALRRLRTACERVKRALSSSSQASVEIDALFDGVDFYTTISRACFEELCSDLFVVAMRHVKEALHDANVTKADIEQVILVGGSTQIPKIQEMLLEYFGEEKFVQKVDPEEVVVRGAALQAAAILENFSEVTPLSICMQGPGEIMSVIIPRNTPLPAQKTITYTTHRDNQLSVNICLYEGERRLASGNRYLGMLVLQGIPPAPKGIPQIDLVFSIECDGQLVVSATERFSGAECYVCFETSKGRLTFDEAQELIREAGLYRESDERECARIRARAKYETFIAHVTLALNTDDVRQHIPEDTYEWYSTYLSEQWSWLEMCGSVGEDVLHAKLVDIQIMYLCLIVDLFHTGSSRTHLIRKCG